MQYETVVSHWAAWQQAYQFGVLLIFPPEPLRAQVNKLRASYDPQSQATCDAHISLTIPLPRPIGALQLQELESIAAATAPFTIHYGPLRHYLPHAGVCLTIEPQEELDRLRMALERASVFAGAPARAYQFSAHMTIAEFISVAQTHVLMHELRDSAPQGDFWCASVSYAVPDANFHFNERRVLALGQA
jgi:2'-5' RNA ligase